MPLYYFEAEGPGWSDYQDDDGIELQERCRGASLRVLDDSRAEGGLMRAAIAPIHLLVKNWIRKTIFRIAFDQL